MTDSIDGCAPGLASARSAGRDGLAWLASERLNAECFCMGLDREALRAAIHARAGEDGLPALLEERCPYVFASRPVFVSPAQRARMSALVEAIESVVALPAYREMALARAPAIARHRPGARGVFFGYDFHVTATALGLIEINTNAGGAMLNALLARAQRACCPPIEQLFPLMATADAFEARIAEMFRNEWALAGRTQPLRTIAIVDEQPQSQYLYPEFLLFRRLFEANGWTTVIADPAELSLRDGRLHCGEQPIDLVYNRLTDFYLEAEASAALREAWLQDVAVITPHPHAHALYADKRNLAVLSDPLQLTALGVPADAQAALLAGIPRTEIVDPANAERLWAERKRLFFKPFAGYGSRATYRGDKITRRVWQEILTGGYIAQALVAPGERALSTGETPQALKFDLRSYVYEGQSQWLAARLYQGQTTNFRTPGGGFAPVYEVTDGCMDAMIPMSPPPPAA
ncbi:hypothetical protein [Lysobacter brunescens]|uniref:Circularly permuted type 2 ATP-grasp protein n=1 Tax=Lysobacter brunescens TaxID=262323 RepID=A0ABW2YH10_9GAMM